MVWSSRMTAAVLRKVWSNGRKSEIICRRMFHLDITADQTRHEVISTAEVTEMLDVSPTVKKVVLRIEQHTFDFKPGQWVDLFIPEVETVGGFSICSAPLLLREHRLIELAVKKSNHPPVVWVHNSCRVGAVVQVRAGGDFSYYPKAWDPPKDLLLLAGGVGINPLRSIILHTKDLLDQYQSKSYGYCPGKVKLLYCARTPAELIFKEDFMQISDDIDFHCTLFASQLKSAVKAGHGFAIEPGRITQLDVMSTIRGSGAMLNISRLACYICGPRGMVNDLIPSLKECGISEDKIFYEAWTVAAPPAPPKN